MLPRGRERVDWQTDRLKWAGARESKLSSLDATHFTPKSLDREQKRAWHDAANHVKTFDYVIRRPNALPAGLKSRLGGLTSLGHRLRNLQIQLEPRVTWSEGRCSKRLVRMVPRSAWIWSSQPQIQKAFMKFVSLRTQRTHRRGKLDKPSRPTVEHATKPMAVPHQIHTYTELRQQIHDDLRRQHPEWVQPNGECPTCDSYEARLMELLDTSTRKGSNESIAAPHRALEHGLNWVGTVAVYWLRRTPNVRRITMNLIYKSLALESDVPSRQTQVYAGMIHVYTPMMRLPFEFMA